MVVFNDENIKKLLNESVPGSDLDVVVHDSIDSTNTWVLNECKAGRILPFACFAEQQTGGRGRRGKVWLMPQRCNIAMSLAWSFALSPQQLQLLPLSIAVAIAEVLEHLNLKNVQVKWPNDVYVDGVKIAGVLIETQLQSEGLSNTKRLAVVIGIGLNYDMTDVESYSSESDFVFTDICSEVMRQKSEGGQTLKPERVVVAAKLLQRVINACQAYQGNTKSALKEFRDNYDYCQNKLVDVVLDDKTAVSGLAKGVTDNAELIVDVNGELQFFNSAEVSVNTGD